MLFIFVCYMLKWYGDVFQAILVSLVCIVCFADDTIVYLKSNDIGDIIDTINDELKQISKWLFVGNKLKFEVEKTKIMYFVMRKWEKKDYEQLQVY